MANFGVRLGGMLTFDTEKEADILQCITELSNSHRLGRFVSHLLRLAFESPEEFGNGREVQNLIEKMNSYGMSPVRYNFFNQISKETAQMKKKIDDIYEMAYKTYMLSQMGKHIGLEDKSKNLLMSAFILERQTTDLCTKLGIDNFDHSFASNKLEDTEEKAREMLEHIILSYDDVVKELKTSMVSELVVNAPSTVETTIHKNKKSNKVVGDNGEAIQTASDNNNSNDDEFVELVEKPTKKDEDAEQKIELPLDEYRDSLMSLLD